MNAGDRTIWTIGHSNRTFDEYLNCLQAFDIQTVVDVRRYPGSRKHPHFNSDSLNTALAQQSIRYVHMLALGGRRKDNPGSRNTGWESASFRAYADYMETEEFVNAVNELMNFAKEQKTAYMCSEALWWRCHRRLISDYLTVIGWNVLHIATPSKASMHTITAPAKLVNNKLSYEA